jgi:alpha-ribazole phosphatase
MLARNIECVFTSVSQRCVGVAQHVAAKLGVPQRLDSRLQELDFGLWEQRAYDEIHRTERAAFDAWAHDPMQLAPPGGESGHAMVERVYSWAFEARGGSILVITHAGVIRILRAIVRRAQELGSLKAIDRDSLTLDWSSAVTPLKLEQLTLLG